MNRFVAPQFIDVEDKIIGPITTRQFVMMIVGGVIIFIAYKLLDTVAFAVTTFIVLCAVLLAGFVKINGRRFYDYMGSMIEALRRPKVRVWFKESSSVKLVSQFDKPDDEIKSNLDPSRKTLGRRRLSQLALVVDTGGKFSGQEK